MLSSTRKEGQQRVVPKYNVAAVSVQSHSSSSATYFDDIEAYRNHNPPSSIGKALQTVTSNISDLDLEQGNLSSKKLQRQSAPTNIRHQKSTDNIILQSKSTMLPINGVVNSSDKVYQSQEEFRHRKSLSSSSNTGPSNISYFRNGYSSESLSNENRKSDLDNDNYSSRGSSSHSTAQPRASITDTSRYQQQKPVLYHQSPSSFDQQIQNNNPPQTHQSDYYRTPSSHSSSVGETYRQSPVRSISKFKQPQSSTTIQERRSSLRNSNHSQNVQPESSPNKYSRSSQIDHETKFENQKRPINAKSTSNVSIPSVNSRSSGVSYERQIVIEEKNPNFSNNTSRSSQLTHFRQSSVENRPSPNTPPQKQRSSHPVLLSTAPQPPPKAPPRSMAVPQPPFTSEITMKYYSKNLTSYEQQEVYDYKDIFFMGSRSIEKVGSSPQKRKGGDIVEGNLSYVKEDDNNIYNSGYDDARGDYYLMKHDHIAYRYEIMSILGKGSFGQVAKCYDHKTKSYVALKIVRNKKRFEKQGLVEVKVLDKLRREDTENKYNLVHMLNYFNFRGHLCFTFELLGIDLYHWLKAGSFKGVNLDVCRSFSVQILQCLSLLKSLSIVHCDLKPENIMLRDILNVQPQLKDIYRNDSGYARSSAPSEFYGTTPYQVKVIDFGSSCLETERIYTYVQSRFYRSPEIILGINYTSSIDMWSLGCILAELYTGFPLFPGENEHEQLLCIMEVIGVPDQKVIDMGTRRKTYFESNGSPKIVANSKGRKRKPSTKSLSSVLKSPDPVFIDFIRRCLEWDPNKRLTPSEALRHQWIISSPAPLNYRPRAGSVHQSTSSKLSSRGSLPALSVNTKLAIHQTSQNQHQQQQQHQSPNFTDTQFRSAHPSRQQPQLSVYNGQYAPKSADIYNQRGSNGGGGGGMVGFWEGVGRLPPTLPPISTSDCSFVPLFPEQMHDKNRQYEENNYDNRMPIESRAGYGIESRYNPNNIRSQSTYQQDPISPLSANNAYRI